MISHLMTHTVDVYHLHKKQGETSFGVPEQDVYFYNDQPEYSELMCSVQRRFDPSVQPREPFVEITEDLKIYFPLGTELKENDKVVFQGNEYLLGVPFTFRTHIEILAWRKSDNSE